MDTPDKPVLLPVLRKARRVVVTCHVSPDGDSVAAMAALSSSLRLARWESVAVSPGPVPEVYQFVPGSDSILVYGSDTGDEPGRSEASMALEQADVIVCVDASDLGRMGAIFEDFRAKFEAVPVINIDHHPSNSRFGVLNLVDPSAAAVCELLTVLMEREDLPITEEVASALLVGIVSDSLGFRTPSTTSQTLRVAAALMERGASLSKTTEKIFNTRTLRAMRLWGLVLGRTRVEGGLVWADITPDILRDAGASMEDADNLVDFIAGVPQTAGAFLFSENGGSVKVSIRSSGDLDAAALAASFGGGGHLRAAGCTLEGSMAQVQERVLAEARRRLDGAAKIVG